MNTVIINNQELEVISLTPYAYMGGKGEKTLQVKVAEDVAGFGVLKELFNGNTSAIKYYENEELKCEYNGYSAFECKYANGVFDIELKKGTLVEQVTALHNANETLSKALNALELANAAQKKVNEAVTAQNEAFALQNELLHTTLSEVLEIVIPGMMGEFAMLLENHEARLSELEEIIDVEAPVEDETVAEETASE